MQEFFWFILGALMYKFLAAILDMGRKYKFIYDIKVLALQLIGQAFQELTFTSALKYAALKDHKTDEARVKRLHIQDEEYMQAWKQGAVETLHAAVPPLYKNAIEVEDWNELMSLLDIYYKDKFNNASQDKNV